MTTFRLRWLTALTGSNDDLISLILHMPGIECLCLSRQRVQGESDLTLDVLPAFAYRCPKLRDLKLFVDCRIPPSVETLADEYARHGALESVVLGASPTNTEERLILASWLNRLLPKACNVYFFYKTASLLEELRHLQGAFD